MKKLIKAKTSRNHLNRQEKKEAQAKRKLRQAGRGRSWVALD